MPRRVMWTVRHEPSVFEPGSSTVGGWTWRCSRRIASPGRAPVSAMNTTSVACASRTSSQSPPSDIRAGRRPHSPTQSQSNHGRRLRDHASPSWPPTGSQSQDQDPIAPEHRVTLLRVCRCGKLIPATPRRCPACDRADSARRNRKPTAKIYRSSRWRGPTEPANTSSNATAASANSAAPERHTSTTNRPSRPSSPAETTRSTLTTAAHSAQAAPAAPTPAAPTVKDDPV